MLRMVSLGLALTVFASALGVVFSTYASRKLFVEMEGLLQEQVELHAEWGRLQLEQSTLATHSRVEQFANEKLEMVSPSPGEVVIVRP